MYGNRQNRFHPRTGGGGRPPQHLAVPSAFGNAAFENPNMFFPANPTAFPPHSQNQNFLNQNFQSHNFQLQNPIWPFQNPGLAVQNTGFPPSHLPSSSQPQNFCPSPRERMGKIDRAVAEACQDLLTAGESVTAWKVSQRALLTLQADSWNSLGIKMQEVPSLHRLMMIEGKVNAFIHCFVGVRRIISLYDLEVAICKNEGVDHFEQLGLGPLLQHPLVMHYFSVHSDLTEVFKITTEEIIIFLSEIVVASKNKEIKVEEFLNFIAKKRSVKCKELLGIRVQSLGMYVSALREARKSEEATLRKCVQTLRSKNEESSQRPFSVSQKKILDERFSVISQRVESFSSVEKAFSSKHIRFVSSSSEDDEDSDDSTKDDKNNCIIVGNHSISSPQYGKSCDRVSNCPYPSAIEEMTRLGLRVDMQGHSPANSNIKKGLDMPSKKKRKSENVTHTKSAPSKGLKKQKIEVDALPIESSDKTLVTNSPDEDLLISDDSLQMFITTWKESCRHHNVAEVLQRMLHFYGVKRRQRVRLRDMFSGYPFIGLLNVAISSIKSGMWNSIYDTFQAINHNELINSHTDKNLEYETIDVGPSLDHELILRKDDTKNIKCIAVEDIIRKLVTYFDLDDEVQRDSKTPIQNRIACLRKLCKCEKWVAEQLCVNNFSSLGYGDFVLFIEKYTSQLPPKLLKLLVDGTWEKSSLEACILSNQLVVLVSQALSCLWEGEKITKPMISCLLTRQFPSIGFEVVENGSLEEFLDTMGKHKASVTSKCVLFSATMIEKYHYGHSFDYSDNNQSEITNAGLQICQKTTSFGTVTGKNAIEVLLQAPMLSDLSKWSHWDLVFEPVLGSLVSWLLNEVNTQELLCLVTRSGKVIRVDHSATVDSFLEAAVQGSSFLTALKLLSVFALVGGEKYVKLPLLKCHARHAFEVMLANSLENMEVSNDGNSLVPGEALFSVKMFNEASTTNRRSEFHKQIHRMSKAVSALSRFVLDCLGYLPAEFHGFAVDVLLSGMQSVSKDAASAILHECKNLEQRLMLHEVGLSLGISEWVNDYRALNSNDTFDLYCSGDSSLETAKTEISPGLAHCQDVLDKFPVPEENVISVRAHGINEDCTEISQTTNREKSTCDSSASGHLEHSPYQDDKDAALIIESIRRDEFGLDPSLSYTESNMLKKQHARLGRALHCLSQELYSQDSHFILELVQNADDNNYAESVEPTLTFILQDSGIVVLNNEQGFSPQNVRALCDVGNSTKKGSAAGYIGKKGIGFKSVFRVTDAPEIHSNGFHVKFDIREGQIGFVLPTVIPPCDVNLFSRMASAGTDLSDNSHWNTCIVLPFRSCLSEGTVMNSIMTMFSDLHPSLLLFLHRLQCIHLRNLLNDTLIVMKKEILGDGIIKVSHGKEKMTWFVVSQKLQTNLIRSDVQTTEISMAFTLMESDNGYSPCLDPQPVFAFLPLRTYGLKFILQGDFVLPSSREEVDGDSPWNQWLLSEYPSLFVRAQREFCELPCFRGELGKAVSAFMSFVPLVGEVHGFFASLPRLIVSKLRMTNCLLVEGNNNQWVPPCNVLRGWTEQVHSLLPNDFLHEHLGLRYLDKNIALSDTLASALGIEEFGPNILVRIISSLCHTKTGILSMGMGWLASCLNTLYVTLFNSYGNVSVNVEMREDILKCLKSIRFVPLSDGSFSSVNEGTIWLHSDTLDAGFNGETKIEAFPVICAKLRTVSPSLICASSADTSSLNMIFADNIKRLLQSIGVKQLSAHDIVKLHILPSISEENMANREKMLMVEYLCFVMLHLKSTCSDCFIEREHLMSELRCKYSLLTNFGLKCPADVPIHFCRGLGNPVNPKVLADAVNMSWHEVDASYLKHPANESISNGLSKWREFFKEIGITDFAPVLQVNKSFNDVPDATFKHVMLERGLISLESIAKDWESPELVQLASLLSKSGCQENCKYLLAILDTLWDAGYSDKCTGYFHSKSGGDNYPFRSTFICSLCDLRWVVSSMDEELHYPNDLFYDCEAVRMILGSAAPYAVPKVKSERLARDVGFKTTVNLGDILDIFEVWRKSNPFKASMTQMSKLYAFIWTEMAASIQKIREKLMSEPFIFTPYTSVTSHDEAVCGMLLSSQEVYWHDPTGCIEKMKKIHHQCGSTETTHSPVNKSLCNIYPGLRGFFVDECRIHETPPLRSYIQILLQLSSVALPSQAANEVFQVFLNWADGLKSDLLRSDDIIYLKECVATLEYPVLPTVQDKWVSLHPSFGLVCWCDDENLKQEFKQLDELDFLYFGELNEGDIEMLQSKISPLMKILGIPALSEVVTREAIYYGLADCTLKASLINWTLPYAQRYLHKLHRDKYGQLKESGFKVLNQIKVFVVEKLFYRNVIKNCSSKSKNRVECSCLLQDNMLYTTQGSDYHALFMELSRLFFDGIPELHLANFLHMIMTMAESGSLSEQIEFFVLNSQAIPRLPDEESIWLLSSKSSSTEIETEKLHLSDLSPLTNDRHFSRRKAVNNSNWPPVDWKTAPDFNYARRANGFKTQAPQGSSYVEIEKDDQYESIITPTVSAEPNSIATEWCVEIEPAVSTASSVLQETVTLEDQYCHDYERTASNVHTGPDPVSLVVGEAQDAPISSSSSFSRRERLQTGTSDAAQAMVTGRLGERLAFKYFVEKVGKSTVKWVNEINETGLPYDIIVGEETNEEFIEVKATRSPRKDWFIISSREWQFAVDKGEAFSIAHVALMGNNVAKITIFKNPVKLCQQGELQLAVMMPRQQKDLPVVS